MPRGEGPARARTKMAVAGATKYYQTKTGAVHALDDVSIEVREGEFLCILGPPAAARPRCSGRWPACTS